ncbi:MAG: hypothetical protein ACRC6O_08680 [Flavobacterium sp.]
MVYKAITPSPVDYSDIFGKKTTPDERLYILRQIQQGFDKVQRGIIGRVPPNAAPPAEPTMAPDRTSKPNAPLEPPALMPPSNEGVEIAMPEMIAETDEEEFLSAPEDLFEQEELAVDVVGPRPTPVGYDTATPRLPNDSPFNEDNFYTATDAASASLPTYVNYPTLFTGRETSPAEIRDLNLPEPLPEFLSPSGSPASGAGPRTASSRNTTTGSVTASSFTSPNLLSGRTNRSDDEDDMRRRWFNVLDSIDNDILAAEDYNDQYAILATYGPEQLEYIRQAILYFPNHAIARRQIIMDNIPELQVSAASGMTAAGNNFGVLTAGTTRSASTVTTSASSSQMSSAISSNGVGPRRRPGMSRSTVSLPSSGSLMSIDSPPIPGPRRMIRPNAPAPIRTNVERGRGSDTPGIADARLNPRRRYRGLPRAVRTQVLEDAIRQAGLDDTRAPRQRR